jgi:hypothetical protein
MSVPRELRYSESLKPVSIPSSQQTRKFLPISSGVYNKSNNVIRIPLNANAFLDLKNAVLRYKLKQTAATTAYLDGSASAIIQRLEVIGPDGTNLSNIDQYNRLYQSIVDIERSIDNREGFGNLLEGSSNDNIKISLRASAVAGAITVWANDTIVGTVTLGVASAVRVGDFVFGSTNVANVFTITHNQVSNASGAGASIAGNTASVTLGGICSVRAGNVEFRCSGAGELFIDGALITVGTSGSACVSHVPREHTALVQSEIFAQNDEKTYTVPLPLCPIMKFNVLFPAMLVSQNGIMLQLTLPSSDDQVFFTTTRTTSATYQVDGVELICPVLNYSDSVVQSLRDAVNNMGSLSMSSTDFQTFIYPYTASANMSIPISVRARSLKALYFLFQSNQSSADFTIPRVSARERINISSWYVRVGSVQYPAQAIQMSATEVAEPVTELLKSVSKLNDMRLGSYLSKDNFNLTQAFGGLSVYGLDFEALQENFAESGLDTSTNSLQTYLEIQCAAPPSAGNCYVFAFYDCAYSITQNGMVMMTK